MTGPQVWPCQAGTDWEICSHSHGEVGVQAGVTILNRQNPPLASQSRGHYIPNVGC